MIWSKRVKRELDAAPDLSTEKGINKWLIYCIHALHLGLITRDKLNYILRICKSVKACSPNTLSLATGYASFSGGINKPITVGNLTLTRRVWEIAFNNCGHSCCPLCERCECGCGKTDADFLREKREAIADEREAERKAYWWVIQDCHGLTDHQCSLLKQYARHCRHGRWGQLDCNCDITQVLAMFNAANKKPKLMVSKYLHRKLWTHTKEYAQYKRLTTQQLKALRRHNLLCEYTSSSIIPSWRCNHSPELVLELMGCPLV